MVMMILGPSGALPRDEVAAVLGHNNPPDATPYEAVKVHVDDLMTEARSWLDGAPVETQAQADGVSKLLDMLRKAKTATDIARKDEAKPFDDGKAEVQARYKSLLDQADRAADACKKALAPFLQAQEAARLARIEAERQASIDAMLAAAEAAQAAKDGDLSSREVADQAATQAKEAEKALRRTEKDRSHASGGARATTLRTHYEPVIVDEAEAARWAWRIHRPEMLEFITSLAKQRVQGGLRQIDGFEIRQEQRVV